MTELLSGRCWWRGHKWTRWEIVGVQVVHESGRSTPADRNQRTCVRCGLTRRRQP